MLTMGAYLRYVEQQNIKRYLVVLLFFCIGPYGKTHAGILAIGSASYGLLADPAVLF
jgi:hypothetical protein